jgi:hypothetical protein
VRAVSYRRQQVWATASADGKSRRQGSRAHAHPRRSPGRDGLLFLSISLVKGCSDYEEPGSFVSAVASTYAALNGALSLPEEERRERALRLRRAALRHDSGRWLQVLLEDLETIHDIKPAPTAA